MSAQATQQAKASQSSRKGGALLKEQLDLNEISTIENDFDTGLESTYGIITTKKVIQKATKDTRLDLAKRSVLQSMSVINEDVRRQINTTVKGQREMKAEIRGTAEKQFSALSAKIEKSQHIVRGDIRNLAGQMKNSFSAVKKQMDGMQNFLQKMDAANQQRFLALQRDMLAINQQIANNHKQLSDLVNQRARETQDVIKQHLDARIQEVKQLQLQLAARLEGEIASQVKAVEQSLGKQIEQQGEEIKEQVKAVDQKLDIIAAALEDLGKELEKRAKELEAKGEELVTVYTCTMCGGSVHNSGCASSNASSRISFKIKKSEFEMLRRNGRLSDDDTTEVASGEIGYRINIGQSNPDPEVLRRALRNAGVNI